MWDGRRYDRTGQPGAAVPHRLIVTCPARDHRRSNRPSQGRRREGGALSLRPDSRKDDGDEGGTGRRPGSPYTDAAFELDQQERQEDDGMRRLIAGFVARRVV